MSNPNVRVTEATSDQEPVVAQLLQLYTYDFTAISDFDVQDNGYFSYEKLPLYWKKPSCFQYLVWVNNKLAGFALIEKGASVGAGPEIWDVTEFFIMQKYRKQGIGEIVAHRVWSAHPGRWQVRVTVKNKKANMFWEKVISKFLNQSVVPEIKEIEKKNWYIYSFISPNSDVPVV